MSKKRRLGTFSYSGNDIIGRRNKEWIFTNVINSSFFKDILKDKKEILDIGSGNGRINPYFNDFCDNCNITNIEPIIKLNNKYNGENVKFINDTFENYYKLRNNKYGKFDLITFFLSFYLINNKEKTIESCINILDTSNVNIFILESMNEINNTSAYGHYSIDNLYNLSDKFQLNLDIQNINVEPKSIMFYLWR